MLVGKLRPNLIYPSSQKLKPDFVCNTNPKDSNCTGWSWFGSNCNAEGLAHSRSRQNVAVAKNRRPKNCIEQNCVFKHVLSTPFPSPAKKLVQLHRAIMRRTNSKRRVGWGSINAASQGQAQLNTAVPKVQVPFFESCLRPPGVCKRRPFPS